MDDKQKEFIFVGGHLSIYQLVQGKISSFLCYLLLLSTRTTVWTLRMVTVRTMRVTYDVITGLAHLRVLRGSLTENEGPESKALVKDSVLGTLIIFVLHS